MGVRRRSRPPCRAWSSARSDSCRDVGGRRSTLNRSDAARKTVGSAPLQAPARRFAAASFPHLETAPRHPGSDSQHLSAAAPIRPDAVESPSSRTTVHRISPPARRICAIKITRYMLASHPLTASFSSLCDRFRPRQRRGARQASCRIRHAFRGFIRPGKVLVPGSWAILRLRPPRMNVATCAQKICFVLLRF